MALEELTIIISLERNRVQPQKPTTLVTYLELYRSLKTGQKWSDKFKIFDKGDITDREHKHLKSTVNEFIDVIDLRDEVNLNIGLEFHSVIQHFLAKLSEEMSTMNVFDAVSLFSLDLNLGSNKDSTYLIDININRQNNQRSLTELMATQKESDDILYRHYLIIRVYKTDLKLPINFTEEISGNFTMLIFSIPWYTVCFYFWV